MEMKRVLTSGKFLNKLLSEEIKQYLTEEFHEEELYMVYSDGSIADRTGHEVAINFVTKEKFEMCNN